jgi:hypothetical protein
MKIIVRLDLAEFFHDHASTLGFILGMLALCFLVVAGR